MIVERELLTIPPIATATPTATNPNTNANICTTYHCSEMSIPSAAPNAAPANTPNIPGETRGLTNIA